MRFTLPFLIVMGFPLLSYGADSAIRGTGDDILHAGSNGGQDQNRSRDGFGNSSRDPILTTQSNRASERSNRNDPNALGTVNNPDHGSPTSQQVLQQALTNNERQLRQDQQAGNLNAVIQDRQNVDGAKENLTTQSQSNVQDSNGHYQEHGRGNAPSPSSGPTNGHGGR